MSEIARIHESLAAMEKVANYLSDPAVPSLRKLPKKEKKKSKI